MIPFPLEEALNNSPLPLVGEGLGVRVYELALASNGFEV